MLESINHPVFGAPILRNGEALVDGGVLMNLPVTALHGAQCDFLIAPDTSRFPIDDFTHVDGLIEAGRAAGEAEISRLKENLDRQLDWERDEPGTAARVPRRSQRPKTVAWLPGPC